MKITLRSSRRRSVVCLAALCAILASLMSYRVAHMQELSLTNVVAATNVVVTGSTAANGSYATLKDAFAAINTNSTQTGNNIAIAINLDTTENASAVLSSGN